MAAASEAHDPRITIEELRDLYERLPFVRGRARVELLRRLQTVRLEVRRSRQARSSAPAAFAEAAGH
jgi:hypothetical protein